MPVGRFRVPARTLSGRKDTFRPVFVRIFWLHLLAVLALTGCLPEPPPQPTPTITATASITPSPSPTIVWFPATITPTPLPTRPVEPTQDTRPAIGELIFKDEFRDPNLWPARRTAAGSIDYGNRELTLAVAEPRAALLTFREDTRLDNVYLEIEVLPSLCQPSDQFGLLLRAASTQDYYRLLVNCSGQVRFERIVNARALVLQDWTTTGQIPPGGLMRFRLGVWAFGSQIRVFINDVFQFAVRDPVHPAGTLGLVARSSGDSPLTVSFSNLVVYAVDAARVPTLASTPTITPTSTATRRPSPTSHP